MGRYIGFVGNRRDEEMPGESALIESEECSSSEDEKDDGVEDDFDPLKTSLQKILQEFREKKPFDALDDGTRRLLTDRTKSSENTVWHLLAQEDSMGLPKEDRLRPLILFLVNESPRLLGELNDQNESAIHIALTKKNNRIISLICSSYMEDRLVELNEFLKQKDSNGKSCIHLAIEKKSRYLRNLLDLSSAETLITQDKAGNTPLHKAVEWKRCDQENQLDIIRLIVVKCDHLMREKGSDFNSAWESPYLHHIKSYPKPELQQNTDARKGQEIVKSTSGPKPTKEDPNPIKESLRRSSTQDCVSTKPQKEPSQLEIQGNFSKLAVDQRKEPVNHVQQKGKDDRPQSPDSQKPQSSDKTVADVHVRREKVKQFLKAHYLRSRGHDLALRILYEREALSGKDIFLDLSGRDKVTLDGIKKTVSTLNFETILQFVHIPIIERPEVISTKRNKHSRDIREVFQTHLKNVTTIFKVIVDDWKEPAHSDVAIENCVVGKGIEIWDWRKLDICPKVLKKAGSQVRELHLYWSGRNAVLRGWSEEDGLRRLKRLEKVTLHVQEVSEPPDRVEANVGKFKKRLSRWFIDDRAKETVTKIESLLRKTMKEAMTKRIKRGSFKLKIQQTSLDFVDQMMDQMARQMARIIAAELLNHMVEEMAKRTSQSTHNGKQETSPRETGKVPMAEDMAKDVVRDVFSAMDAIQGTQDQGEDVEKTLIQVGEKVVEQKRGRGREMAKLIAPEHLQHVKPVTIDVVYLPGQLQGPYGTSPHTSKSPQPKEPEKHQWIECMQRFKELLYTAEKAYTPEDEIGKRIQKRGGPIMVALIDDGVDVDRLNLGDHGAITGRGFCPRPDDHNYTKPHYASSRGHGTLMASQIYRICPRARLMVLKLEDIVDRETDKCYITPKSAAQAIRHAVQHRVDIISMSWTIVAPDAHTQDVDFLALDNALLDAQKERILMFCSASDQGPNKAATFPAKSSRTIVRIGGADADGNLWGRVGGYENVDYTFPGKLVDGDLGEGMAEEKVWFTGSSVATALAAGLAALILYCAQVRIACSESNHEDNQKAIAHFNKLKTHDGMVKAFDTIGKTNKYLSVWEVFDKTPEREKSSQYYTYITDVATRLCSSFS